MPSRRSITTTSPSVLVATTRRRVRWGPRDEVAGARPLALSSRCSGRVLLTLAGAVEGNDRDLEHVVRWFARRELLSREDRQQHDLHDRVGPVAGHEADELESRPGDEWDRNHTARDQPEPVRVEQSHDREHDHAHNQDDEQEAGAATRVKQAGTPD